MFVDKAQSWIEVDNERCYNLNVRANAAGYAPIKYQEIIGVDRPILIREFVDRTLTKIYTYVKDCRLAGGMN